MSQTNPFRVINVTRNLNNILVRAGKYFLLKTFFIAFCIVTTTDFLHFKANVAIIEEICNYNHIIIRE